MNYRIILAIIVAVVIAGAASFVLSRNAPRMATTSQDSDDQQVQRNANANTSGLVPRTLPEKPAHATIPDGYDAHTISVKFMDDLDIGISPDGYPVGRTGNALRSDAVTSIMNMIKKAGGKWLPASSTIEQERKIDELRKEAEKSGRAIADLNNYFTLTVPVKEDATKWMDLLNVLTEVEIATAAIKASVPPT